MVQIPKWVPRWFKCIRCGHEWLSRIDPAFIWRCPKCKGPHNIKKREK